jgi:integrase
MPKFPKPFFRSSRSCWFVQIGKEQIKLHPEEQESLRLYHELMAERGRDKPIISATPTAPPLAEVFDKFLDWCQTHRAPRTFAFYHDLIQAFLDSLTDARLPATDLRPYHVIEWVDKHPDWSQMSKRQAMVAIQRPLNWAEEVGYIANSPIKRLKKPQQQRRDNPMTPQDFADILNLVKLTDPFHDLLLFSWHSGCRPQEARHIEARHVTLAEQSIVIPKDEAKGRKRPRTILLHGPALDIVARLLPQRGEGKLFLNGRGRPWKKDAIGSRFHRLNEKLGKRFALVDARHGFCQRLLESGANHMAVAELLGHVNGRMVSQTYSHMNKATSHLKDTLRKAAGA